MKKSKRLFALLMVLLISLMLPFVFAKQGHMKLLAVSEDLNEQKGGIADLYLEIKPGTGRVFLETFPLTRVDTQISTRFAKEISCEFANADCEKFDFFYTITADSAIIAGPSAGAPITILTISLLDDIPLKDDVLITGTINSGGFIGQVGGIKVKIEAAKREKIQKVLVPKGIHIIEGNKSYDIKNLSKSNGIDIIEVSNINEALEHFTGRKFSIDEKNVSIEQSYQDTMKILAIELCSRSTRLSNELLSKKIELTNATKTAKEFAINFTKKGKKSYEEKMYYSSASYCFGANVEYNYLLLSSQGIKKDEITEKVSKLKNDILKFDEKIIKFKIKTITDLESYMVVKERLLEADEIADSVLQSNNTDLNIRNLAFAIERFNSANSWSNFMDNRGKEFIIDKNNLKVACMKKLSEVEERFQYVQLYFPQNLATTRKELDYAYKDLNSQDFELCLFKASKAKSNVDIILSVIGISENDLDSLLEEKQKIVKNNIIEEMKIGVFPILGYSYYEYANALRNDDPYSSLLYSEYALELSDLDIYFKADSTPQKTIEKIRYQLNFRTLYIFVFGILIGAIAVKIIFFQKKRYKIMEMRKKVKK